MERISISTADLQDRVEELTDRIRTAEGQDFYDLCADRRRIENELNTRQDEESAGQDAAEFGGADAAAIDGVTVDPLPDEQDLDRVEIEANRAEVEADEKAEIIAEKAEREAELFGRDDVLSREFHLAVLQHLQVDAGVTDASFEYPGYIELPMADQHIARVGQHGWDYVTYLHPDEGPELALTIPVDVDEDETDPSAVAVAITEALDCRRPPLGDTVTGDWLEGLDVDPNYPALIESRWSGGVTFATDRETVERIVADQAKLIESLDDFAKGDVETLNLTDDGMLLVDMGRETERGFTPADDGLYHGLGFGWTWVEGDPALPEDGGVTVVDRLPHGMLADDELRELAEKATRALNENGDYHAAIVDAVESVVGTRDFPGDVSPGVVCRLDDALEGMFRELIENAHDAKRRGDAS